MCRGASGTRSKSRPGTTHREAASGCHQSVKAWPNAPAGTILQRLRAVVQRQHRGGTDPVEQSLQRRLRGELTQAQSTLSSPRLALIWIKQFERCEPMPYLRSGAGTGSRESYLPPTPRLSHQESHPAQPDRTSAPAGDQPGGADAAGLRPREHPCNARPVQNGATPGKEVLG